MATEEEMACASRTVEALGPPLHGERGFSVSSVSSLPGLLAEPSSNNSTSPSSSTCLRASSVHTTTTTRASAKGRNSTRGGGMARQRRNSWMRSSVVRRAATVVDEEVAALCEKSPFLNSLPDPTTTSTTTFTNNKDTEIALFHRLEVQIGKALGRGGFAEVYTVSSLDIGHDHNEDHNDNDHSHRRRACQAAVTTSSGRPAYAIKFLRKKLLSNTREFQHAAIDLAVESKYLAALNHANIIKIRGLTRGGTSAFRTGKHDDFFIIMDHLQETLEYRIQRWQQRNEKVSHPSQEYFPRTLQYAYQIADALTYLHEKAIVYRDLKPQNLGFKERDVIQLFDFGLCRELPKPKGQSHHDEDMEDEETFHMSGVGTQRYMAPEILTERRYNLKADVYSFSMVALEMMTWKKPFSEYTPEEHQLNVAQFGERPRFVVNSYDDDDDDDEVVDSDQTDEKSEQQEGTSVLDQKGPRVKRKRAKAVLVEDWPLGMPDLIQEAWNQNVGQRLTMQSVLERVESIVANFDNEGQLNKDDVAPGAAQDKATVDSDTTPVKSDVDDYPHMWDENQVVLEFPSHFSPVHPLSSRDREAQYRQGQQQREQQKEPQSATPMSRDDSDRWFGDRQSDTSASLQELTLSSASTTFHDSNSTG